MKKKLKKHFDMYNRDCYRRIRWCKTQSHHHIQGWNERAENLLFKSHFSPTQQFSKAFALTPPVPCMHKHQFTWFWIVCIRKIETIFLHQPVTYVYIRSTSTTMLKGQMFFENIKKCSFSSPYKTTIKSSGSPEIHGKPPTEKFIHLKGMISNIVILRSTMSCQWRGVTRTTISYDNLVFLSLSLHLCGLQKAK